MSTPERYSSQQDANQHANTETDQAPLHSPALPGIIKDSRGQLVMPGTDEGELPEGVTAPPVPLPKNDQLALVTLPGVVLAHITARYNLRLRCHSVNPPQVP